MYDVIHFSAGAFDREGPAGRALAGFAKARLVFVIQPPEPWDGPADLASVSAAPGAPQVLTPRLPADLTLEARNRVLRRLIDGLLATFGVETYVLWYATPSALAFTRHLDPWAVVADFLEASTPLWPEPQAELLDASDLVFLGEGPSPGRHPHVHRLTDGSPALMEALVEQTVHRNAGRLVAPHLAAPGA